VHAAALDTEIWMRAYVFASIALAAPRCLP
jgi:hypothetical protein